MPEPTDTHHVTRRGIIAAAALVPVTAFRSAAAPPDTQSSESVFSRAQRRTLEAFMDRLAPKDDNGPSASECGAANYIDLSLADALSGEKAPFLEALGALEAFARRAYGAPFAELPAAQQDEVLIAMENNQADGVPNSRNFFERVRRLTLEGMFSDPHYGGNRNFAGWDIIRYPGPRMAVPPQEQEIKISIKPLRA